MDDILYSPIKNNKLAAAYPNWRNISITIHLIGPALLSANNSITWTGPAQPGIHYAYPDFCDVGVLQNEIYEVLELALNRDSPEPPAGNHWPLQSVPRAPDQYGLAERSKLQSIGINPIGYHTGVGQIIWGFIFMDRNSCMASICPSGIAQSFIDLTS